MASMEKVDDDAQKGEVSQPGGGGGGGGGGGSTSSQPNPTTTASSSSQTSAKAEGQHSIAAPVVGDFQMFPKLRNQEEMNHGPGLYAVPVSSPFMGPFTGYPPNTLIPLTYSVPTRQHSEAARINEDQGLGQQQPVRPRRVEWRVQVAVQFDILLLLKLAAFVYLLGRDSSRQRLFLLVCFASLVYLYQTGVLNPLVQWLSQKMLRLAAPPRPPRQAEARPNNAPLGNENGAIPDGQPEAAAANEAQPLLGGDRVGENENVNGPPAIDNNGGNRWWGLAKEIQMIVFGFITSLLPGFHNID